MNFEYDNRDFRRCSERRRCHAVYAYGIVTRLSSVVFCGRKHGFLADAGCCLLIDKSNRGGRVAPLTPVMPLRARRLLLASMALVALVAAGLALAYRAGTAPPAESSFAAVQRGHLLRLDGASVPGRVVFLGSSTFQGLDVSAVTPLGLNLSIGGDTLAGLSARAARYRSLASARAVVVNIGLNDLLNDCAMPRSGVDALWPLLPAALPVVVVGVQQIDAQRHKQKCAGALPGLISAYNGVLGDACRARPGCRFVANPLGAQGAGGAGAAADSALREADGIHLSVAGYRALAAALRRALGDFAVAECVAS